MWCKNISRNIDRTRTSTTHAKCYTCLWAYTWCSYIKRGQLNLVGNTACMEQNASAIAKSCFHQIRNIGRIRSYITVDACKTLVCSLVASRMDYGNASMYGVNASIVSKLQRVQNTTARLVTRKKKYEYITPTLVALHWLPFKFDVSINCYCTHSNPCMD